MKIIKHGSQYSKHKKVVCALCSCVFEYEVNDTEIDGFCFMTIPPTYKAYIKCPECGSKIFLDAIKFID